MISNRKAVTNKHNASLSTGPRTVRGKLRSSQNAHRHGLATPIAHDASAALNIDRLVRALTASSNDYWRIEKARVVAESHFDLARIRAAKNEVLSRIGNFETADADDLIRVLDTIEKIARYERRTRSKLRRALGAFLEP
jgi:hypothetical protein